MLKKVFSLGLLLLLVTSLVYAASNIVNVTVNNNGKVLNVEVSVDNKGAWLGCSFYTSGGRVDKTPSFVTGRDTKIFDFSGYSSVKSYEVALWAEKYKYGEGPDPKNAWAKINGYYLWNELDRKKGNI